MSVPGSNPNLPTEVLQLVCQELASNLDFGTLFEFVMTGRDNELAKAAVHWIYRIHNKSPVVAGDDVELTSGRGMNMQGRSDELKNTISLWALQWKSIIRSSIGTTFYPYCLTIRSLDLRNLEELLADSVFRDTILEDFFAGDMSIFLRADETPPKKKLRGSKKRTYQRIDIPSILDLVGESITSFISAAARQNNANVTVEDLAGAINPTSLQSWTSKLPKLKSLTLWDGAVLNRTLAATISACCLEFDDLTFFNCIPRGNQTIGELDHELASFFDELRKNSLQAFSAISAKAVGPETLLALNNHSKSLKVLKLDGLISASMKALSLLRPCNALETLTIADAEVVVSLEITEHDVFLEVVEWLGSCENLRFLRMTSVLSAPAILTQVLSNHNVKLTALEVYNYVLVGNTEFHQALSKQKSLESLRLRAFPDDSSQGDTNTLVTSICALRNLKYLNLETTSDHFEMSNIADLATNLRGLVEFWFSGQEVDDDIWAALSSLQNLKSLNIHAVTSFTADGILRYISTLGPNNHKIQLSVMNQNFHDNIEEEKLLLIRQAIAAKADGQFFYVLLRDADSEDDMFSD